MKRNSVGYVVFFACVAAGPFVKLYLERRGLSTALAWVGGFAVLGVGVMIARIMRSAPSGR